MSLTAPSHSSVKAAPPLVGSTARSHISPSLLVAGAAAAVVAAGTYAAVGHHGSSPAVPARGLEAHVLSTTALPGLVADGQSTVIHTPAAWSTARPSAVAAESADRLQALGLTAAIVERMHSAGEGVVRWTSVAERYRTVTGARLEASYQDARLRSGRNGTVAGFPVVGVPGGQGVSVATTRGTNVAAVFAAGKYAYLVSARFPRFSASAVARSQVSAAAGWLYLALSGCVTPPHHAQAPATPASRPLGRI